MPLEPESGVPAEIPVERCVQIARAASGVAMGIGVAVLVGWAFDLRALMTVLPGFVAMKPNTAVAFCWAGLSMFLFLRSAAGSHRRTRQISLALAGAVILLGALTLGEYGSGFHLGIDELVFADYVSGAAGYAPGRMAPLTAGNFIALGLALAVLHFPGKKAWAQGFTIVIAVSSLLVIVGYFYGVARLYQSGNSTAIALHTAVAFEALCLGVWCASSNSGFMHLITGSGASGMLLRRYGLAVLVLPFFFGWLRLQGERYGWYGTQAGSALVALANVATFATLIWIGARSLRSAELDQAEVRESLLEAHLDLEDRVVERTIDLAAANFDLEVEMSRRAEAEHANQQIMDNSLDVICTFDAAGRFLQASKACEALWGYRAEELIGRSCIELVHPEDLEKTIIVDQSIISGEPKTDFENRYVRKDGSVVTILWTAKWSQEHQINFCVARDITARKHAEGELLRAKEAAEAANRAKSEFLANMSHEIRTPMNGILGMTELVLETTLNDEQRDYLGMVKSSAHALLRLINDILDFSKIEAGKLELEAIGFPLRHSLATMFKPLSVRAGQKNLELAAEILEEVPEHLIGDPLRLRQVLINLIDNAIKFTEYGSVRLRVEVAPDLFETQQTTLHFSVTDTGIGIAEEKQALIFEAFAQADGTMTRTYGGTGLGLAIASQLVRQMGGHLWLDSTAGEGTTFHFTARLGLGQTPVAPPEMEEGSSTAASQSEPKGLRILLADDNRINRALAAGLLEKRGHFLTQAVNGREAVEAATAAYFDLVLMDVQMPEMDGLEATRRIRGLELGTGRRTPIAALTAHALAGDRERCLTAGMDDYLTKPLQKNALLPLLERISADRPAFEVGPAVRETAARDASVEPSPIFSRAHLLDELDDDEALMQRMIAIFRENTPLLLADIRSSVERRGAPDLARTAHALLSSLGAFGAHDAHHLTRQLEAFGQQNDLTRAGSIFGELERETAKISAALERLASPEVA